ncbi:MAG TPA: radical SAM protein [Thermodesulfovibrionales bacterium]|nr:radical SAM protein [Thermodesulfovibrionales bacterium]
MSYKNNLRTIKRKSLLYRSGVEYGDFCINHVEGCSHGCLYPCYAMMLKKRTGVISSYEDWCKPKLVENAIELLEKEIPRYKSKIKFVHLCFSTDPFMYGHDEVGKLSIEIVRRLNDNNITCTLLTKGVYPVELLQTLSCQNEYGITLVSLDEAFRQSYEPYTASFEERIEALRYLHEKGFKTWVSIEPYPTPNIVSQELKEILDKVSFSDKIVFGRLNYSSKVKAFPNAREFYNSQAKAVVNFCKGSTIKYHIKQGTVS